MKQSDLSKFLKRPLPKALSNHATVILSIKKCLLRGFSFLKGLDYSLVVPFTNGVTSYYGEQQFSYMANGTFKVSDSKKGSPIYVPLSKQGFDVSVIEKLPGGDRLHRVEVKTIYKGTIIGLSNQQVAVADVIAIYNPRYMMQSFAFRDTVYEIPSRSYLLVKLH